MKRIIAAAAALFAGAAFAQGQGVSKNEIVIGSMQDLSGPIVAFSKQLKFGMEMRVEIKTHGIRRLPSCTSTRSGPCTFHSPACA